MKAPEEKNLSVLNVEETKTIEYIVKSVGLTFVFFDWFGTKFPSPSKLISNVEALLTIVLEDSGYVTPENADTLIKSVLSFLKKEKLIIREDNAKLSASNTLLSIGKEIFLKIQGNKELLLELPNNSNLSGFFSGKPKPTYTRSFLGKLTSEYLNEVRTVVLSRGHRFFREIKESDADSMINDFIVKALERDSLRNAILTHGRITPQAFGYWCVQYATYLSKYKRKHRVIETASIDDTVSSSCFSDPRKNYELKEAVTKMLEIVDNSFSDEKEREYVNQLIHMRYCGNSTSEIKEVVPSAWYWSSKIKNALLSQHNVSHKPQVSDFI